MRDYVGEVVTMLLANSDVTDIFDTRIFAYNSETTASNIGFEGLNYDNAPDGVYDADAVLQPTIVVYGRQKTRLDDRFERAVNRIDLNQLIEVHMNDAKHVGFGTLHTGNQAVYSALENKKITGGYKIQYVNDISMKGLTERFNTIVGLYRVRGYYIPT